MKSPKLSKARDEAAGQLRDAIFKFAKAFDNTEAVFFLSHYLAFLVADSGVYEARAAGDTWEVKVRHKRSRTA